MSSQYSISDSEATTSEAPSAFMNEDDSIMSESVDIMGSGRSARSLNSEYSGADVDLNNDSSMQRLVENLNDMDNQFGSLISSQTTRRTSTNSQATPQDSDLQSLQDELNGARLGSPAKSILVETVDEDSCHQSGMMNASLRRMPSAGASSLSNIREEGENNNNYGSPAAFDNIQESHPSQQSRESPVVETVDEASCHESGMFSSNRRNSTDTNSTGMSGDHHPPPEEEFDPSYYKKRETQPPTPQASYDGYETTSTAGGFSNSEGMGAGGAATTEHQWDNLQSTLDQQTDEVRSSPYYSTPPGKEAPFSPTGSDPPNTEGLRRQLDSAALAPPVTANRDVETAPNNNGTYWPGDKAYDENYDDELLDVSLGGAGGGAGAQPTNNGKNPTQSANALRNFVGDEAKYQMVIKSLAGCICCMIIWTLAMIIVLATK